jgi:hypothetical protein
LDRIVEREILSVLESPTLEVLEEALEEAKRADEVHVEQLKAEQERLEHRVRIAREHFENCDHRYKRVFVDAQNQLEKALTERESFHKRISPEELKPKPLETKAELHALCDLAKEVPALWKNPEVTHHERKELLRCVIDKVVISPPSAEVVNWTIYWKSGSETPHSLYRRTGYKRLVQELHTEGYSVHEIRERLANGQTSTGQSWKVSVDSLYSIMKRLGLRPNKFPSKFRAAKEAARALYENRLNLKQIAYELNQLGYRTLNGKEFSPTTAFRLLRNVPRRTHQIDSVQREVFSELGDAGATNREIARELNRRKIPRHITNHPWTRTAVKQKNAVLKRHTTDPSNSKHLDATNAATERL